MGWADQGRELYLGQEKATAGLVGGPEQSNSDHKRITISIEKDVEGQDHEPSGER
jgi:hypothetical protein